MEMVAFLKALTTEKARCMPVTNCMEETSISAVIPAFLRQMRSKIYKRCIFVSQITNTFDWILMGVSNNYVEPDCF